MSDFSSVGSVSSVALTPGADEFIVQLALERTLVAPAAVERARRQIAEHADLVTPAPRLLALLVADAGLDLRRVAEFLAADFGLPLAPDLGVVRVSGEVLGLVPREFAARYKILPFAHEGRVLKLAISDPIDTEAVDNLGHMLKLTIEPHVATADDIAAARMRARWPSC